jgi:DivIVA domain-containing protein
MDSTDNAFSALDAIDTVAFKVGLKGYNVDEVDEFLERLSAEARQLKDQLAQQRQQLRQAAGRIDQLEGGRVAAPAPAPAPAAPAPEPVPAARPAPGATAERVTSMIAMAQQFIEHAQQEAEAKARELTVAAQERAREIVTEARSRAEDEVNRLNGLKQRLGEDVEKLARQLETERTRLGSALAEFARWVDATLQVGGRAAPSSPPAAAPPPRPVAPPPAPEPDQPTIGQVLRFEAPSDERS